MIWYRWAAIHWFTLGDTDDNLRIAQVRAWLNGQDWSDLRQYKLDPPGGADIHWSRFVDLPIAAIIVAVKPFFGGGIADRAAVAIAPLLPLGLTLCMAALSVRRLVDPRAFWLGAAMLLCAQNALYQFAPLRIDHHGWQLTMLATMMAGLVDPRPARGGIVVGVATAVSLVIGLEMMIFIALAAGAIGLRWVWDRDEAIRMRTYALALSGGTAIGFALFASYANRAAVCDALSPVWLSVAITGALLLFGLSWVRADSRPMRLALAAAAGGLLIALFALAWPGCLGRPEGVSPELDRLWLSNVREAKPLYLHKTETIITVGILPLIGLFGALYGAWRARGGAGLAGWLTVALFSATSFGLLFMQARVGAPANILAIPGAALLAWNVMRWMRTRDRPIVRVLGTVAAFALFSGLVGQGVIKLLPAEKVTTRGKAITRANKVCPTLPALHPIAKLPPATIMTFVDLGPRLIAVTPHRAIAGPYHRNGEAILDVHHAFDGTPETARQVARKHGATLLMICPGLNESTVYQARSPKGFYARLAKGEQFDWLERVPLPKHSPYKLWRVR
jgi:MFS family permease